MRSIGIRPAQGRDYKSREHVLEHLIEDKLFRIFDPTTGAKNGSVTSFSELLGEGWNEIRVRFNDFKDFAIFKVRDVAEAVETARADRDHLVASHADEAFSGLSDVRLRRVQTHLQNIVEDLLVASKVIEDKLFARALSGEDPGSELFEQPAAAPEPVIEKVVPTPPSESPALIEKLAAAAKETEVAEPVLP